MTGFGRFPGAPANPSAAIVAAIGNACRRRLDICGIDLSTAVLPVEYDRIGTELAARLARAEPDGVLHLGLAGRRRGLTVDGGAKNRLSLLHPDAGRRGPGRPTVVAGGPERRNVRLPVARLAAAMARAGAPTRLSNDAGAYVCNATLYLSLGTLIPLAGFIHVPWPRPAHRRLSQRRADSRPTLAAMVHAVTAALLLIAAEARRNRRAAAHCILSSRCAAPTGRRRRPHETAA